MDSRNALAGVSKLILTPGSVHVESTTVHRSPVESSGVHVDSVGDGKVLLQTCDISL